MIYPRSLQKSVAFTPAIVKPDTALTDAYFQLCTLFNDTKGYDHCGFYIHLGTIADALTFAVFQDTSATVTGSVKALTGATFTIVATDDGGYFFLEFNTAKLDSANGFRYVTCKVTGTSGSNYAEIAFFGLHARSEPVTQSAYCLASSVNLGG